MIFSFLHQIFQYYPIIHQWKDYIFSVQMMHNSHDWFCAPGVTDRHDCVRLYFGEGKESKWIWLFSCALIITTRRQCNYVHYSTWRIKNLLMSALSCYFWDGEEHWTLKKPALTLYNVLYLMHLSISIALYVCGSFTSQHITESYLDHVSVALLL